MTRRRGTDTTTTISPSPTCHDTASQIRWYKRRKWLASQTQTRLRITLDSPLALALAMDSTRTPVFAEATNVFIDLVAQQQRALDNFARGVVPTGENAPPMSGSAREVRTVLNDMNRERARRRTRQGAFSTPRFERSASPPRLRRAPRFIQFVPGEHQRSPSPQWAPGLSNVEYGRHYRDHMRVEGDWEQPGGATFHWGPPDGTFGEDADVDTSPSTPSDLPDLEPAPPFATLIPPTPDTNSLAPPNPREVIDLRTPPPAPVLEEGEIGEPPFAFSSPAPALPTPVATPMPTVAAHLDIQSPPAFHVPGVLTAVPLDILPEVLKRLGATQLDERIQGLVARVEADGLHIMRSRVKKSLECPICLSPMRKASMFNCGHTCCTSCAETMVAAPSRYPWRSTPPCFLCREHSKPQTNYLVQEIAEAVLDPDSDLKGGNVMV